MGIHPDYARGGASRSVFIPRLNLSPAAVQRWSKITIPEFPCLFLYSEQRCNYLEYLPLASTHVFLCKICCLSDSKPKLPPNTSRFQCKKIPAFFFFFFSSPLPCESDLMQKPVIWNLRNWCFPGCVTSVHHYYAPHPPPLINLFILLLVLNGFVKSNSLQTINAWADDCFPWGLMNNSSC